MTAQRLVCGLGLVKIQSEEKSSDESVGEAGSTPVGVECQAVLLGLSVREAVGCGSGVTLREATRLRRLADQRSDVDEFCSRRQSVLHTDQPHSRGTT
jgi:hypothetical protein